MPLIYIGAAFLLNTSCLTLHLKEIQLKSRPIPFYRNRKFNVEGVQQFWMEQVGTRDTLSFSIKALDRESHVLIVAPHIPTLIAANQIVHLLQDYYDLEYQPIYGVQTARIT